MVRKLTIGLLFISVTGIILFVLIGKLDILNRLSLASSFISSVASVITLILAILLFEKYGVEKNVLDKNVDRIEKLIEEIRKVRLLFKGNNHFIQIHPLENTSYDFLSKIDKTICKSIIVVNLEYANRLDSILTMSTDPFLPNSIAKALRKINLEGGRSIKTEDLSKIRIIKLDIIPNVSLKEEYSDKYIIFNNFTPQDHMTTLDEYASLWKDLGKNIQEWLNRHSRVKADLNINIK